MGQGHRAAARENHARLDEKLEAQGLEHWASVLETWLPHFDGWRSAYLHDEAIIDDDAPAEQVLTLLARYAEDGCWPSDLQFAEDMAHLDFLTWRARHEHGRALWNCLEEPFTAFAQRGQASVWQYDTEYPSPSLVKYWLLGRLFAVLHAPPAASQEA